MNRWAPYVDVIEAAIQAEPFEVTTRHENVPSPVVRSLVNDSAERFQPVSQLNKSPSDTIY